jgi:hypothetical protein
LLGELPRHQYCYVDSAFTHLDPPDAAPWDVKDAQRRDVYGTDFTTIEYRYLQGLVVIAHDGESRNPGGATPIGQGRSGADKKIAALITRP